MESLGKFCIYRNVGAVGYKSNSTTCVVYIVMCDSFANTLRYSLWNSYKNVILPKNSAYIKNILVYGIVFNYWTGICLLYYHIFIINILHKSLQSMNWSILRTCSNRKKHDRNNSYNHSYPLPPSHFFFENKYGTDACYGK